ncbi:TonB-dependent receptor [Flavobacterium columnare]|nr:TonB-dependent receptor [Flavobacterium columnare]AMO20055.1 TonB-dependent receptor [Flavobacterium columnare]AUX17999.1 ferric enterobactin receptor [Flavobacterium columnare]MBF6653928.1 TonB-dependent receptor [Flavobacterium columnare]MBF6656274.1 TonB-dependent receptor [Flavobacterium columnare]MBF6658968.1 TonB-dependent receptor [Flavobacterium columnare]
MKKIHCLLLLIMTWTGFSQNLIKGSIKDTGGLGIPGVNITANNAGATTSDFDGSFSIKLNPGKHTLKFNYMGYKTETREIELKDQNIELNIVLQEENKSLDEVVVVGTRTAPRSNTTTSLPIDLLSSKELASTGQASFDKALQYRIPSFNTVQTPVNDATSLLDPYEIRNMGPSRTLILINGKRKNMSALVYTQTSPGRGETGADISAIPQDAIERVEILRDGASAQYGSDAIAGVMNIILKNNPNSGSTTLRTGITGKGDGKMIGASLNNGTTAFNEKGFINYTLDFSKATLANRPGTVDAQGEAKDFNANIVDVQDFLNRHPDAGNTNGSPATAAAKFEINGGLDTSENSKLYFNGAYVYKKVNSFANYRTPYWRTLTDYPFLNQLFPGNGKNGYDGYAPTFEGDLNDYNATLGLKSTKNGWNTDLSITFGGNTQEYTVNNSFNRSSLLDSNGANLYLQNSPISFKPGGTKFDHIVGNIDINKNLTDKISFAIGTEFRTENFTIIEGDKASWDGMGADSFAGNRPENSGKFNRYNIGGYIATTIDFTKNFLIDATLRGENYSDFGTTYIGKLSGRYKFLDDKITLRASVSSGFRAPSLHQIYTQKSQYSFFPGQGVLASGLVNNVSPQARQMGIEKLKAEKSENYTIGLGFKPMKNITLTLDYYHINVYDRIVLSDEIKDVTINGKNLGTLSFFTNALDTRTRGIDVVASIRNIKLGSGDLGFNLSGNYTFENWNTNKIPVKFGKDLIDATQQHLLFTSRPKTKWILGTNYDIGKFGFSLNNTLFGKTVFKQVGLDSNLRTEFKPKVVTDLGINFNATNKLTFALNINNLFNILPKWEFKAENSTGEASLTDPNFVKTQSNLITFNQRYSQMTYDGYHFSQLGTMFSLSLNYKF